MCLLEEKHLLGTTVVLGSTMDTGRGYRHVSICMHLRATPRKELSMLCILYLVILEEKRESNNYCICLLK
jgi:hypothetical protein